MQHSGTLSHGEDRMTHTATTIHLYVERSAQELQAAEQHMALGILEGDS